MTYDRIAWLVTLPWYKHWKAYRIKENMQIPEKELHDTYLKMRNLSLATIPKTKFYWACGHDAKRAKYDDWICCDLREIACGFQYDILLGFPFRDSVLTEVKSKLSIGFFTLAQTRQILNETNRSLCHGGKLTITYRDFDLLLARRDKISATLFIRYLYGNQDYTGGFRRRCWTIRDVKSILGRHGFSIMEIEAIGMNRTVIATKVKDKLIRVQIPKLVKDEAGRLHNVGGDFYGNA